MADGVRLIAGLGNPGREYAAHRHNAGFWWVEALAAAHRAAWRGEPRFACELARIEPTGGSVWLCKPQAFMNRSGQAVQPWLHFHKYPVESLLVVHDELDLPPGTARLKRGGGHGGHNGLRDLAARLPSADFLRLRIGIGHPGQRDLVTPYVLHAPSAEEHAAIDAAIAASLEVAPALFAGEFERAMQQLHTQQLPRQQLPTQAR